MIGILILYLICSPPLPGSAHNQGAVFCRLLLKRGTPIWGMRLFERGAVSQIIIVTAFPKEFCTASLSILQDFTQMQ